MEPFYEAYPNITVSILLKSHNLDLDLQFVPLFDYILNDSTTFAAVFANFSQIDTLHWAANLPFETMRNFLTQFMQSNLRVFYHMMNDQYYLASESIAQECFQTILDLNIQPITKAILSQITMEYFSNKRCILSLNKNLVKLIDEHRTSLTF